MYYQNVNSMRGKLNQFVCNIQVSDYDIIMLTETWLNGNYNDAELGLDNYSIYRSDRELINQNLTRGGGVLIAVKKIFVSRQIIINNDKVETLFIKATVNNKSLILNCAYIPPASNYDLGSV
uniref:Uncharacterized protein n=1 Tax=Cacopsylla melanoneura TaxID=428564 RepID=A0A8D8ZDD8_9HEMI